MRLNNLLPWEARWQEALPLSFGRNLEFSPILERALAMVEVIEGNVTRQIPLRFAQRDHALAFAESLNGETPTLDGLTPYLPIAFRAL
jgi:hypothetical protein